MGYEHLKKGNEHLKKGNEHLKNGVEHLKISQILTLKNTKIFIIKKCLINFSNS